MNRPPQTPPLQRTRSRPWTRLEKKGVVEKGKESERYQESNKQRYRVLAFSALRLLVSSCYIVVATHRCRVAVIGEEGRCGNFHEMTNFKVRRSRGVSSQTSDKKISRVLHSELHPLSIYLPVGQGWSPGPGSVMGLV